MVLAYLAITVPTTGKLLWEFRKKFCAGFNNIKEEMNEKKKVDIVIYPVPFLPFPDESCEIEMDKLISRKAFEKLDIKFNPLSITIISVKSYYYSLVETYYHPFSNFPPNRSS